MLRSAFDKRFYQLCSILLFSSFFAVSVFAQSESGSASLEGTVKDSTGAIIQGASISVKNNEIGLKRNAVTDLR